MAKVQQEGRKAPKLNSQSTRRGLQLAAGSEGSQQLNTFSLSLKNVKVEGFYPSEDMIHSFLINDMNIDVRKLYSVSCLKAQKSVNISFIQESDLLNFERRVFGGINFWRI